jgi:pyridinium-3,5-bisthiocarboxylic acid mononucleotide nickel chelatase
VTRVAYLDCVGGLAGDMLLAALLDAGAHTAVLERVPEQLGLDGVAVLIEPVERHGVMALHVDVRAPTDPGYRDWRTISALLADASLDETVRTRSRAVLERLAEAEATIHGVSVQDVHFHELGAVDTLVDVCGTVALLANLGVERVVCSPLPVSRGLVKAAHGVLPLPAPATLELLRGAPLEGVETKRELVTPTGAALAATLADDWGTLPSLTIDRIGYGAGTADPPDRPNIVRVLLGEGAEDTSTGQVSLLETNLDDLVPELVPDAVERCFAAGALDVWTAPAHMKKGRPGIIFAALARPADERAVAAVILEETSALGVRVASLRRYELDREERAVPVAGGTVRVKVGRLDGRVVNLAPEHDDCADLARRLGKPVKAIWAAALAAAQEEP